MAVRWRLGAVSVALASAVSATLFALATPASADATAPIDGSVRYGCTDGGYVEVTVRNAQSQENTSGIYQIGLTGSTAPDPNGPFPDGWPSLVRVSSSQTTVRLAGTADTNKQVFVRPLGSDSVQYFSLGSSCRQKRPLDFKLSQPTVQLTQSSCNSAAQQTITAKFYNPNSLELVYRRLSGLADIDYTTLFVRTDTSAATAVSANHLLRFDGPGWQTSELVDVNAKKPVTYQVRLIGIDGVATTAELKLDCSSVALPTSTPSTPSPGPTTSTPAPKPSGTTSPTSSGSSSPSSTGGTPPLTSIFTPPAPGSVTGPIRPNVIGSNPPRPSSSSSSSGGSPTPSPGVSSGGSPSPSASRAIAQNLTLGDVKQGFGGVWSADAALVVGIDAVAISALVGATVIAARRR
ncbi:MAG: hypothetical protein JWN95_1432 [Frankiales bacterium]|nr:hypothetical protein [Frankiales bacterium]